MCGIYGTTKPYTESQVKSKLERTSFRGPDKMGWESYMTDKFNVVFGHNRLSIIDLDERSNQPFTYYEKIHLVFNGEIYNFHELKRELVNKGYLFKTTSDTEVICASYLEYGEDCVKYFNGMFAFVIYDIEKNIFFGARDRLGKKPFYYYHSGFDFEFSSQISSIQLYNVELSISQKSIYDFLALGAIPEPNSIFNEVKKLPAGHLFKFDLNTCNFTQKPYWDIDYQGLNKFVGSYDEAKEKLEKLISESVNSRLFADVPVGVFLSGGIDSSIVSAIAKKESNGNVKTFAIKFNEKSFDESKYAEMVAMHLKTDHHTIECNFNEGLDLIENFSHYYDEPFADSSAIPSLLLAKHTKKHVTVALSGDGGDESFIGYGRYNLINKQMIYNSPQAIRTSFAKIFERIPGFRFQLYSKLLSLNKIEDFYFKNLFSSEDSWLEHKADLLDHKEFKYLHHRNKNLLERVSDFDIKTYLNWDINTKVDRATMAYSLEARAPLMDYKVIEFARTLPTNFKYVKGNQKRILKDILYKYVPKEMLDRPKMGFAVPFPLWFRNELKPLVLDELDYNSLKEIQGINVRQVEIMIQQHMSNERNHHGVIWKLLVLKQWLKKNGAGYAIR